MSAELIAEKIKNSEVGVFEETSTLNSVLMWGEPSTETALAQLLPTQISCFYSNFDISKARLEFQESQKILENSGVNVIRIKDLFAQTAPIKNQGLFELQKLKSQLHRRANLLYQIYQSNLDIKQILNWVDESIELDIDKYGLNSAIYMNNVLSNRRLPLGNIIYARDQSNMLGNILVFSSMRHPIRQPEVDIYKKSLESIGILNSIQVSGNGRFEGGDGIMHNGIAYIGIGGRTNLEGVRQVAPYLLTQGSRIIIVYSEERDKLGDNEMDAMHLDTFWMPITKSDAVACPEEMSKRKALEVVINQKTNSLDLIDLGGFEHHLHTTNTDIISVTKDEQEKHATNFLNTGPNSLILTLPGKSELRNNLNAKGKQIKDANLEELTKGYGGLHCMTAAINREN